MAEEKALIQKFGDQNISTAVHPPVLSGPPPGFPAKTETVEIAVNNDELHSEASGVKNSPRQKSHSNASVMELKIETPRESVAHRLSLSTTSPTKRSSTDAELSPKNPPSPNEIMNDEAVENSPEIGQSAARGQKRVKNQSTSNSEESGVGDRSTDSVDNRPAIPPKPSQKKPRGGGALPALSNRITRSQASPVNHSSPSASARGEAPVSIGRGRGVLGMSRSAEDTSAPFGGKGRGSRGRGYMKTKVGETE